MVCSEPRNTAVHDSSLPLFPPLLSKHSRPLLRCHLLTAALLVVILGNRVSLHAEVSCRSSFTICVSQLAIYAALMFSQSGSCAAREKLDERECRT